MVNDKKHPAAILMCCFAALAAAAFMGIAFGAVSLSPKEVLDGIMDGEVTANGRIKLRKRQWVNMNSLSSTTKFRRNV